MFQAGNKVLPCTMRYMALLALYAGSTLFSLIQPSLVIASDEEVSKAVTKTTQAQNVSLDSLKPYRPDVKIFSYKERSDFVYTLRTDPAAFAESHPTRYALSNISQTDSNKAVNPVVSEQVIEVAYVTPVQAVAAVTTQPDTENYQLNADILFTLVNQHRASIGIGQVQKDDRVMQVARERVPELFDEIFVNGNMHAGFNARKLNYPASEIIIYYNTEEGAMQWWLHSPIHRSIIQNGTYTHAGIACSGKSCTMIFATL